MICYFDTSAFVPILIDEPSSRACRELWTLADAVITTRLLYVEAMAALSRAERTGRITAATVRAAGDGLDRLWPEFQVIELDDALARRAAALAESRALRGYDAVHCAAAGLVDDPDVVAASGDKALLAACRSFGMATADVNDHERW